MSWNDEEQHQTELLLHIPLIDGEFAELQQSTERKNRFRISVGNLFGSQSAWFSSLKTAVKALERTRAAARDKRLPIDLKKMDGFIRLEDRPKQEVEVAAHGG